jgi:hypothetical protein
MHPRGDLLQPWREVDRLSPEDHDQPSVGRDMFVGTTHGWAIEALRDLGGEYETADALTVEQEWLLLYRMARRLGIVDLYAGLLWAGGNWYPNPQFEPEAVTRDSVRSELAAIAGLSHEQAEERMQRLDALGERIRREGAADSIALFDEMLAVLGLPGSDGEAQRRERDLGQMSELLEQFDHALRRAAPAELYAPLEGSAADEAAEDGALAPAVEAARTVLGGTGGEIYLIRLRAFLEQFAGRAAEETPDSNATAADAVQVMTIHQAKGLEFTVVFVPCLVEGRFPSTLMGRPRKWYVPADLFDRSRLLALIWMLLEGHAATRQLAFSSQWRCPEEHRDCRRVSASVARGPRGSVLDRPARTKSARDRAARCGSRCYAKRFFRSSSGVTSRLVQALRWVPFCACGIFLSWDSTAAFCFWICASTAATIT